MVCETGFKFQCVHADERCLFVRPVRLRPFTVIQFVMRNHYAFTRKWNYVQINLAGFQEFPKGSYELRGAGHGARATKRGTRET